MLATSGIWFFAIAVRIATAAPSPGPQRNSFITGEGNEVFGNEGVECTVGRDVGECSRFGQCAQFIPPNESSVLNQGREVDECVAGGPVGVLDENGDVVPL
ncbi:hypothetical protein ONS96_014511 [Cadophora gregata f. sp. sojae]|nr:hypothetical protein ONS96_014511 [Cadophora gregata f. sp. sojae]